MDGLAARLAGAPISWGVCEVPGWGAMLPPERVLGELAGLGLGATELGPADAWLSLDAGAIRAALEPHGLRLVGGFVPLVLHERSAVAALVVARRVATELAAAGADTLALAAIADAGWSPPPRLDDAGWQRLAANVGAVAELTGGLGVRTVIHPHAGTLVQDADQVERLLALSEVPWCLDPGHLAIGGIDPLDFVRRHGERIAHVHLKDVDHGLASQLRGGDLGLRDAVAAGLFRPLGQGHAPIDAIVGELELQGYAGWLVLEQDRALDGSPPAGEGPVREVAASVEFLARIGVA